jgi:biopolymer transport protein ExbB
LVSRMNRNLRSWAALIACIAMVTLVAPAYAQQSTVTSPSSPEAMDSQAAPTIPAGPTASDATVGVIEGASRPLRASLIVPRELSPWSMFMSADIIVKTVMVGLAFASLVSWTIFIAKFIELFLAHRRLRRALDAIADVRSIAEARVVLGSSRSVLATFLAAALREARLSAGISTDSGIKERAASSFAEITRAEARRMRIGMGLLATIGATSPFVGLFGTVWGIMNSFTRDL